MPEPVPKNTDDISDEDDDELEVVADIEIPNVKLNKNGTARKPLSADQRERNLANLAKAREKARLQKLALSSKSKAEQDQAKKLRADKLAASKLKKAEDRASKDAEIEKFKNKNVEVKDETKPKEIIKEEHVEEVVPKPKPKAVRKKQTRIILEQDSSESEPEEIVVRTRKTKKTPPAPPPTPPPAVAPKIDHVSRVPAVPIPPAYTPEEIAKLKKQKETFEREQKKKLSLMNAIFF